MHKVRAEADFALSWVSHMDYGHGFVRLFDVFKLFLRLVTPLSHHCFRDNLRQLVGIAVVLSFGLRLRLSDDFELIERRKML